jgi:ABC-type antimicrobial peptide transport system permease subunit
VLRWAWLSLWREPGRLIGSALGVGLAFTLVVFFQAALTGESERIVAYPRAAGADVWVMQNGVSNMHMASSMLWDWKEEMVKGVEGVRDATPILYMNGIVRAGQREWFSYVVGRHEGAARGGPWAMVEGKSAPSKGEAVIPHVVARLSGIGLGDKIQIVDRELRVVGLSAETFSVSNAVTFVFWDDLESIMGTAATLSYLLVTAKEGENLAALAERIELEVDKVSALPQEVFLERDHEMALQMGTEIIRIMVIVGGLVAILVVAFTAYSQVVRLQRDYAVAKAVGFRARSLAGAAVLQNTLMTGLGLITCALLSYLLIPLVPRLAPQIGVLVSGSQLGWVVLAALPVAVIASLVPVIGIARVDPMSVFRG